MATPPPLRTRRRGRLRAGDARERRSCPIRPRAPTMDRFRQGPRRQRRKARLVPSSSRVQCGVGRIRLGISEPAAPYTRDHDDLPPTPFTCCLRRPKNGKKKGAGVDTRPLALVFYSVRSGAPALSSSQKLLGRAEGHDNEVLSTQST